MQFAAASCLLPTAYCLLRKHLPQLGLVGLGDHDRAPQPTLALARLARQDVPLERLAPDELPRSRLLEALRGATVTLQLRHIIPLTTLGGPLYLSPPRCALGAPLRGAFLRPSLAAAGAIPRSFNYARWGPFIFPHLAARSGRRSAVLPSGPRLRPQALSLGYFRLRLGHGLLGAGLLRQDRVHLVAFLPRHVLRHRHVSQVVDQPLQDPAPDFRVCHFTAAEEDRRLHLVAVRKEALDVLLLELVVVLVHLRPEL